MANMNKVILIGRFTRDPEVITFQNGGKVARFGFAVSNRRKNQQTGSWEDYPMFIDCKAFNRQNGRQLADLVENYCRKGKQYAVEGRLELETWDDKNGGGKRSKHVIIVDDIQFLDPKESSGDPDARPAQRQQAQSRPANGQQRRPEPAAQGAFTDSPDDGGPPPDDDQIPF
ncbi:MAG TPA: single-stranded DNA-binding protein [Gemmataceae bacterium]|nr:single-stranded DNA-binding protein [Gemmataceae bacterium]